MKNYNFWSYFKKLGDVNNPNSSKSFALLVSTITGGILAVAICFILIFDVLTNGYVKTDLADLGIFLLCVGGYIAGSGVTKAISDRNRPGRPPGENCNYSEDEIFSNKPQERENED